MSVNWRTSTVPEGVTGRIFLVRHGETESSARGLCYGKLDVALSDNGRLQIENSTTLLHALAPDRIVSSPRIRALDSAAIIAKTCNLTVATEADLAELDFGDLEGMRYEEVERQHPEFYSRWMAQPTAVTFPNGESYSMMYTRVQDCFSRLVTEHRDHKLVLVAHGGVIRIILAGILDLAPEAIFRIDQSYAAISCIDFYADTPVIRVLNWLP